MSPHRIHLRRAWLREATAEGVLWLRKFGCPSRLGQNETVWLGVRSLWSGGLVAFNGQAMGPVATPGTITWYEVTARLQPRNEARILFAEAPQPFGDTGNPPCEVFLEIRSS